MNYIIFFFLLNFILSIAYTRSIFVSFLFSSFFLSFSEYNHLSIAMLLFSVLWGYSKHIFVLNRNSLLWYLFSLIFLGGLISLSYINGANLLHIVGKFSRVVIILFFLFSYSKLSFITILGGVKSFMISSFISSVFLYLLGYYDDIGFILYRISGFLNDANYFALICLVFIVFCDLYYEQVKRNLSYLKFVFLLFIFFSQSWSTILLYLLYVILYRFKFINQFARYSIAIFPFVIILLILFFLNYYGERIELYSDWLDSELSLKFNSVFIRFNTILNAYVYMENHPSIFHFGMGSGRSLEIGERVFHNLYFQQLFDHGWVYYVLFQIIVCKKLMYKCNSDRKVIIVFLLMLHNMMFDNFYLFLFSFALLILESFSYNEIKR